MAPSIPAPDVPRRATPANDDPGRAFPAPAPQHTTATMRLYSAGQTRNLLPFGALIEALRDMFRTGATAPLRHHHAIALEGQPEATLLLMPAWSAALGGVKIVNVNPGNAARGMPALSSSYLVFDTATGRHLAMFDGAELTNRRTAATSALAAGRLARPRASSLLVVGAGRVAAHLPGAFRAVRPIERVAVWDIDAPSAERLARRLAGDGFRAVAAQDLKTAVADADIVSCATLATEPLIAGAWLRPGQHLDLIGSFTPAMREADDDAVRLSRVFVDTRAVLQESGDLIGPLRSGALSKRRIAGDLFDLCRGDVAAGEATRTDIEGCTVW